MSAGWMVAVYKPDGSSAAKGWGATPHLAAQAALAETGAPPDLICSSPLCEYHMRVAVGVSGWLALLKDVQVAALAEREIPKLRDGFALAALQGIVAGITKMDDEGIITHRPDDCSEIAYVYAAAMLAERAKVRAP